MAQQVVHLEIMGRDPARLRTFYSELFGWGFGVEDIEATLAKAESLGGTRRLGPERVVGRDLVIGHFTDPAGNLIGVGGPPSRTQGRTRPDRAADKPLATAEAARPGWSRFWVQRTLDVEVMLSWWRQEARRGPGP